FKTSKFTTNRGCPTLTTPLFLSLGWDTMNPPSPASPTDRSAACLYLFFSEANSPRSGCPTLTTPLFLSLGWDHEPPLAGLPDRSKRSLPLSVFQRSEFTTKRVPHPHDAFVFVVRVGIPRTSPRRPSRPDRSAPKDPRLHFANFRIPANSTPPLLSGLNVPFSFPATKYMY